MIRLHRNASPAQLSPTIAKNLTAEFSVNGSHVWNRQDIKATLSFVANNKCAYCEARLGRESMYLEVEHFYHKDEFPDRVVKWENLLPACRRCNGNKGTHNVQDEPIIDPFNIDPKIHLSFKRYRLRHKTDLGKKTIEVLDLNNHARAVLARFEIGEEILKLVETCSTHLEQYIEKKTSVRRTKLLSGVRALLDECQASAAYASTSATVLCSSAEFDDIIEALKLHGLWNEELETLFQNAHALALQEE
ncbi:hypothetical protein GFPCMMHI_02600 [Ensifer adhaerens]|nr:hypothetical protein [Ensifer adhaerens]